MARLGSLALDGSLPRDGVSIKTLVVMSPHHHCPLNEWKKSEIRNNPNTSPVAGTLSEGLRSPGSSSVAQQWGPMVIIMLLL